MILRRFASATSRFFSVFYESIAHAVRFVARYKQNRGFGLVFKDIFSVHIQNRTRRRFAKRYCLLFVDLTRSDLEKSAERRSYDFGGIYIRRVEKIYIAKPHAAAVLKIVPRLPGSLTPSSKSALPQGIAKSFFGILQTAQIPYGETVSATYSITSSLTAYTCARVEKRHFPPYLRLKPRKTSLLRQAFLSCENVLYLHARRHIFQKICPFNQNSPVC